MGRPLKGRNTLTATMVSNLSLGTTPTPAVTVRQQEVEDSFGNNIKYTMRLMFSKRMALLLP